MATWIHVVCRSAEPVTYAQLEDVMAHMGWLDEPVTFDPPLDDTNRTDPTWRSFRIVYDAKKRPIIVRHVVTKEGMAATLSDIRDRLDDVVDSPAKRGLAAVLDAARQMFEIEMPDDPRPDVWEMLDAAEAYLARERDGLIVADEGVFDGEMTQILRFGDR